MGVRRASPASREDAGGWQARDASGWELSEVQVLRGADRLVVLRRGSVWRRCLRAFGGYQPILRSGARFFPKSDQHPTKKKAASFESTSTSLRGSLLFTAWGEILQGFSLQGLQVSMARGGLRGMMDPNAGRVAQPKGSVD